MLLFNYEAVKMNLEAVKLRSKSRAHHLGGRGFFVEKRGLSFTGGGRHGPDASA